MTVKPLLDVLVSRCVRDLELDLTKVRGIPSNLAAEWFLENVGAALSLEDWAKILEQFTDELRDRGLIESLH